MAQLRPTEPTVPPDDYASLIVWDAHACFPLSRQADLSGLERHRAAGATFVFINVGMDYNSLEEIIHVIAGFRRWIHDRSDQYCLVETAQDILLAKKAGKLAVAFDLEGTLMLQENADVLNVFRALGVRQMLLAYNRDNPVSGGCWDNNRGLGAQAPEIIRRMNDLGILLDCSHMSERSSLEAIDLSTKPVVFSHSNVRAISSHPRNLSDAQIDACAKSGGVIGLTAVESFLGQGNATDQLLKNVEYISARVGPQSIGIGLDYVFDPEHQDMPPDQDHSFWYPDETEERLATFSAKSPEYLPEIAEALLARGYGWTDVKGMLGENFLRVAFNAWGEN